MFYARGLRLNSDLLAARAQLKSDTVGNPFGQMVSGQTAREGKRGADRTYDFSAISNGTLCIRTRDTCIGVHIYIHVIQCHSKGRICEKIFIFYFFHFVPHPSDFE